MTKENVIKPQKYSLFAWTLLIVMLVSCNNARPIVEVTNLSSQTVEVSTSLSQSTIVPESSDLIATPDVSITIKSDSVSLPIDPVYFDGFIVLVQYYTFLNQGAYQEAISQFSLPKQNINNPESDIAYFRSSLESIEIRFIYPFDYWLVQKGQAPLPPQQNEIRYVVGTTVIYKGAAWNNEDTRVPYDKISFISLIMESGDWKIDEINSSPWFSKP